MANIRVTDLDSPYIFKHKNQVVYYDIFTKKAYGITSQEANTIRWFSNRMLICACVAVLFSLATSQYLIGVAIFAVTYAASTAYFSLKYLPTLFVVKSFVKPEIPGVIEQMADNSSFVYIYILIFFAALLLVMSVVNLYFSIINKINIPTAILLFALSLTCVVVCVMVLIKKKKKTKKV